MYKYAEIYGGRVRDVRESYLDFTEFCSIWDPASFWLDVTGVTEIQVGWLIKSDEKIGTYFEAPPVFNDMDSLDVRRAGKLEILDKRFRDVLEDAYILSSLGFFANAGTRAKGDVDGIITQMEEESIDQKLFMDYNNVAQMITLEDAKTLRIEIIKNGEKIYFQKWALRDAIKTAQSIEELEGLDLSLYMYDFMEDKYLVGETPDASLTEDSSDAVVETTIESGNNA